MSKRAPARPAKRAPRPWWRRLRWKRLALLLSIVFVLLFFILVGAVYVFAKVPEPSSIAIVQSIKVVDHNGRDMGRISSAGVDRVSVPIKQMPLDLRHAVIATEDRHFYKHHGIRVTSIFRAALANLFGGGVQQGGSTITQQYVKNAFVGSQRSMFRKVKEAVLAIKFERKHTKDTILEDYLNTIYFGRGAYGCEAAASAYFGEHCRQLTLPQSAMLAGIIRAPGTYEPADAPEKAKARRDQVFGFMVRDHYITQDQAERAKRAKLGVRNTQAPGGVAPHYFDEVRRELERRLPGAIYRGGIRVVLTLDRNMQTAAKEAIKNTPPSPAGVDAALVAVDPRDGAVRAWIGARDYAKRQDDLVKAHRQPGSSFKPVVLAAAIKQKVSTREVFAAPARIKIDGQEYSNYGGESFGAIDLEQATWHSVNTVYVQLIKKAGVQNVIDTAHEIGISSKLQYQLGLALGDSEVTPLELVTAYSTFAARGIRHDPYIIEEVTDASGHKLFTSKSAERRALDRHVADTVTSVLQGVIRSGTGAAAAIGRPAAGKTGTTSDNTDAWFAGYTPQLAAVVWTGFAESRTSMGSTATGGNFPAKMWRLFMQAAMKDQPVAQFADAPPQPGSSGSVSASPTTSPSPSPSQTVTLPATPTAIPTPPKKSPTPTPSPTASTAHSPLPTPSPTGTG